MLFHETSLKGAYFIDLERHCDERGFFARLFCEKEILRAGLESQIVQINNSLSVEKGTTRGFHFQIAPKSEAKYVRCLSGSLWDVILDLRVESVTYLKSFGAELSVDNRRMMYVPKGFAHGFQTLEPNTEVLYLMTEFYSAEHASGLRWNDPDLNIEWPLEPSVVSVRDQDWPLLRGQS